MKNLFVICTKNDTDSSDTILKNIESINKYQSNDHVVVVDSCSTNKSYMSTLLELEPTLNIKIYIEDIYNQNYEYGSILHAYIKYNNIFDKFIFLQDSITLTDKLIQIENLKDDTVCIFGNHSANGCDGCDKIMDTKKIPFSDSIPITIWNSFGIYKQTFDIAINSEIFKQIKPPTCKAGSRGWERAWSIIWANNNIQIIVDKHGIKKEFLNRQ